MEARVVLVTCADQREAEKIARTLVEERLAACVNLVPRIESIYWWKGKIEVSAERLLLIKTAKQKVEDLIKRVKEIHSYEVAEIISLPVLEGNKDYLDWIQDACNLK